jgi:hypothetical protein
LQPFLFAAGKQVEKRNDFNGRLLACKPPYYVGVPRPASSGAPPLVVPGKSGT